MEKSILLIFLVNYGSAFTSLSKDFRNGVGNPFIPQNVAALNTEASPAEQYFSQKLDHLSNDERVWDQRYWKTDQYYKSGGPVFVLINGMSPADPNWIVRGQYLEYAQKLGAMAFLLEHRFCGNSRPLPDTSTENLAYLNSKQTIGDIANFIQGMKKLNNLPEETKCIVFGGSYTGALASWARLKYPDVVHGAVASSALSFLKVDFKEYSEFIKNVLASYDQRCPRIIQEAHKEMDELLKSDSGRKTLEKTFQLCDEFKLDDPDDISNFFEELAGFIMSVVQYSNDNRESPTKDITGGTICDILLKENGSPVALYGEVNKLRLQLFGGTCVDFRYQPVIDSLKSIDYDSANNSDRVRIYRDCSEFGHYQTSSTPEELFGAHFPVEFLMKHCEIIFGPKFNRKSLELAVTRANKNYGGFEFNAANTVFVNGSEDPWSAVGITKAKCDALYDVISIKGGAHCSDMYPSSEDDSNELKAAREEILKLLNSWITQ